MNWVYVLKSLKDGKFYIGSTKNVAERLVRHNNGRVLSTKHRAPFELVYQEHFSSRKEAIVRERQFKKYKSHKFVEKLIEIESKS